MQPLMMAGNEEFDGARAMEMATRLVASNSNEGKRAMAMPARAMIAGTSTVGEQRQQK